MADASDQSRESTGHDRILARWEFPAVPPHRRGRRWYLAVGAAGAVMAAYGVWTGNYVFVLLLALFALTFHLVWRQPHSVRCEIRQDGVAVGATFYPYRELKRFWILYQPPEVKTLYLEFANPLKPRLPIALEAQNPVEIRHLLMDYLPEDLTHEEEPIWDQMSRIFKL